MIHNREADEETAAALEPLSRDGRPPLLLVARRCVAVAVERGYYVSFAGNVDVSESDSDLREAAARVPADRILVETDSPYLAPQPVRGRPNEPANVVHTRPRARGARGEEAARARGRDARQRGSGLRIAVSRRAEEGARPALPRRREHPRRHRATEPARPCRRRARGRAGPRRAHALSRRQRGSSCTRSSSTARSSRSCATRSASVPNVDLIWGDALEVDIADARPEPTKLVANLPYNVATPLVVETLEARPVARAAGASWCSARSPTASSPRPRTKAYGAVSVLVQLAGRQDGLPPGLADGVPSAAARRVGARRLRRVQLAAQLADVRPSS